MSCYEIPGKAAGLAAEEEHVLILISEIRVAVTALGGGEKQTMRFGSLRTVFFHEIVQRRVDLEPDVGPVVQAGTLQGLVIYGEAQRLHQVEHGIGGCAGAGYISGVGRDLGFYEYYVK